MENFFKIYETKKIFFSRSNKVSIKKHSCMNIFKIDEKSKYKKNPNAINSADEYSNLILNRNNKNIETWNHKPKTI